MRPIGGTDGVQKCSKCCLPRQIGRFVSRALFVVWHPSKLTEETQCCMRVP